MNNTVISKVLAQYYSINKTIEIKKIELGNLNQNFFVQTEKDNFFVKVVEEERRNDVICFTTAEELLAKNNINVIKHQRTLEGDAFVAHDEGLLVVYPFIEGTIISKTELSTDLMESAGIFLGNFHGGSRGLTSEEKALFVKENSVFTIDITKSKAKLETFHSHYNFTSEVIALKQKLLNTISGNIMFEFPADVLIHGDYQPENFFVATNKVVSVFDLEKVSFASRYQDLARFILFVCFHDGLQDRNLEFVKSFLEGYRTLYDVDYEMLAQFLYYLCVKKLSSTWNEQEFEKTQKTSIKTNILDDIKLFTEVYEKQLELSSLFSQILANLNMECDIINNEIK